MMKRLPLLSLVTTLLLLLASNAGAVAFPTPEEYAQIYMVANQGDKTEQTDPFAWDQKPWLYLKLEPGPNPNIGPDATLSVWTWDNLSGEDMSYYKITDSTKNNIWVSYSNARWEAIRQPGDWAIRAGTVLFPSEGGLPKYYYGNANFSVLPSAPEPVSSILFLTGGLVFAGRSLKRRFVI